jgi:ribosomal protein S18 acetylase RimI-like enzyme
LLQLDKPFSGIPAMIRTATPDDINAIVMLWGEVVVDAFHDGADDVRRLLARDPHALLVAVDSSDRVVGTLIVGWDGWRGNLYRMAVAASARRQGIAAALVAEGERRLAAAGCGRISAVVVRDDEAAPAFWRSAGYEFSAVARRFVKNLKR